MLNEIAEFKEYTFDLNTTINSDIKGRLGKRGLIKEDFSGLYRAMFILARGFLFHSEEIKALPLKKQIDEVTKILKVWLGFEKAEDEAQLDQIQNWFPNYLKTVIFSTKKSSRKYLDTESKLSSISDIHAHINNTLSHTYEKEDEFKSSWKTMSNDKDLKAYKDYLEIRGLLERLIRFKSKYYSNDIFYTPLSKSDKSMVNTTNMITYQDIIADAFNAGPLRRSYLVHDEGVFNSVYVSGIPDKSLSELIAESKKYANIGDFILKYAAAFLINRVSNTDIPLAVFKMNDMVNWSNLTKMDKKFYYIDADGTEYELFRSGTEAETLNSMRGICSEWIKKYDMKIICENDLIMKADTNKICLKDNGANQALKAGDYQSLPDDWFNKAIGMQ